MNQQMALLFLVHAVCALFDELDRRVARRDLDRQRIVQQTLGEPADIVRVSRREQEVLPLCGQQLDHATDVVDEAHVEHAVRFVEDQDLDLRQIERALLREIEQAPGGRDENVAARAQRGDLRVDADAAEDLIGAQAQVLAVAARAVGDLGCEFARRREHERARRGACRGLGAEKLQDRQHESGGFAGAGLRAREDIAAREHRRDRLRLNGRGRVVAFFGDGAQQFGHEPEIGK